MTKNEVKKIVRRVLPRGIFDALQRLRKIGYKPPPEIAAMRTRHLSYQPAMSDMMALRPGIILRIDPRSREPFEWFCFRSPEMVNEMDYFMKEADKFASFVDVGANHGVFSLAFSSKRNGAPVLAIDPSPIAFEILERNRGLNGFTSMRTLNIACGNQAGEIRMIPNWHHLEAVSDEASDEGIVSIKVETLDDLCAGHNVWPDLIKIDVEGFELPVIQGGEEALNTARLLFLEIHPQRIEELGFSQVEIFDHLSTRDWTAMTLQNRTLSRAEFSDRIHTFWTVCRKIDAATA